MSLFKPLLLCFVVIGVLALAARLPGQTAPTQPADERATTAPPTLTAQCQQSIDRAVQYLLAHQGELGAWMERDRDIDAPGRTAVVGLALLSAGQSHQSAALVKATKYLRGVRIPQEGNTTYNVGLRAAFFAQLPEPMRKVELPRDVGMLREQLLIKGPVPRANDEGSDAGMYGYGVSHRHPDFSNSQYGVLGVWYAALAGLETPTNYWSLVEGAWQRGQKDGGWAYTTDSDLTSGSMTAAGVATLFITYDYLHAKDEQDLSNDAVNAVHKKRLNDGIDWLGRNFAVAFNPGRDERKPDDEMGIFGDVSARRAASWVHYMLFGFERAGEASGRTRFGEHKWFDEGARQLVGTQNYDGSWNGEDPAGTLANTAYAVLFLSRGRAPVAIQKLQYDSPRWNNRSRDAATLVKWLTRQTERHTNWQIVSPDATAAELREAPILYIAGDRAIALTPDQKQRIKTYVDQGGLLLAVNEGAAGAFTESVTALARELYPTYAFRELPPEHPIFKQNFPVTDPTLKIHGLSNGVRELIVLIPSGDLSWKWQAGAGSTDAARAPAFAFAGNLWLYVTDKANPRFKGEDTWVDRDESARPAERVISVARLRHAGNWDPEPLGWTRLSNMLHNAGQAELRATPLDATADALTPAAYALAHLTATDTFELLPDQIAALKKYLAGGGVLLFDAAGGSTAAQLAFEQLLAKLYLDAHLAPLPENHAIYNGIASVVWRRFAVLRVGRSSRPQLAAATVNGRIVAIASAEDLTAGLVGYNIDGITGYSPASAFELMRNILLWRAATINSSR